MKIDQRDRNVGEPLSVPLSVARVYLDFITETRSSAPRSAGGNHIRPDLMVLKGRQRAATLRRLSSI